MILRIYDFIVFMIVFWLLVWLAPLGFLAGAAPLSGPLGYLAAAPMSPDLKEVHDRCHEQFNDAAPAQYVEKLNRCILGALCIAKTRGRRFKAGEVFDRKIEVDRCIADGESGFGPSL